MGPEALSDASLLLREEVSAAETFRRLEVFLGALAALPKKSWRPRVDDRGIRVEGPGLRRVDALLERLGVPSPGRKIVHVVGTSGKGSTLLMMAEAFDAAGVKAAAFFSPHLTSLAERFWIRGRYIDPILAGRCGARLAQAAGEMAKDAVLGPPSYFEATLGVFLLAARQADCEVVLLEAGLGGTYDATHAVTPAVLDVVTSIGLDHTDLLGRTVARIARDKAGIITPGGRVLSGARHVSARWELARVARARGAALFSPPEVRGLSWDAGGCRFDLCFADGERWEGMRTRMCGAHQALNAAIAAGACRLLDLREEAVRAGAWAARLPCRLEAMPGQPSVILDGAHNRDKARALAEAMDRWPARRRLFVLGAVGDKDYRGMARVLAPAGHRFFVTLPPGGVPRPGLPPGKFRQALVRSGARSVEVMLEPWSAFDAALSEAGVEDVVVVAGSLYLAGELRRRWVPESRILETGRAFPPELGQ
ncbi:MAG: cyanophycin synthetase [Nitrospinota bacterium]